MSKFPNRNYNSLYALFLMALLYCCAALPLGAQQRRIDPWWITLEEGKRYFRNGAYGEALEFFENARESRKNYYAAREKSLIEVLSLNTVRRLGDDLSLLERYIEKEFRVEAADALKELYYRVPRNNLRNSSNTALREMGNLKRYPEAEYWLGEVYRVEGEYGIALTQYQKAYDDRALMENPAVGTEILYKMAELRRTRREHNEMTSILEEILKDDPLWSRESFDRANMLRSLETNGVNRFLVLFRHNEPKVEKAHRNLGFYYYNNGRYERAAENLLFAFLIQNTVMIDALLKSQYDYEFTSLNGLLGDIARRRDILAYVDEVEYFRTLYYLANALYAVNRRNSAREIWAFLRDNTGGEWSARARAQLSNPRLEAAREP